MKQLNNKAEKYHVIAFAAMLWLMVFQSPLEEIWKPFSYIDESVALIGAVLAVYEATVVQKFRFTKNQLYIGIALSIFVLAGLTGNLIYRYQPWKSVIIDLYTNLKFFFAIGTGYYLFRNVSWENLKKIGVQSSKTILTILFCIFIVDRFVNLYPAEVRYGIKSAVLFYSHPTYLAGAMAFLVVLLMVFYEKKNLPFIAMALVMMAFTMRSKAITSAAAYVAVFLFFAVWKRKLKLWHIAALGAACVIIAWPQISYYFIELGGRSTRSVILLKSFTIMKDYFPIGTGFGTYASAEASKHFSPVYEIYNFEYLLRFESNRQWLRFLNDSFWPIILGQTGVIGTIAYVCTMGKLFFSSWRLQDGKAHIFTAILYIWIYILICSLAEPAFNNSVAVPLAVMMGYIFGSSQANKLKRI